MNLVNELQVSAEKDDVLTVLRKTKRLASKLGRDDLSDWLRSELDGYTDKTNLPDYRKVQTTIAMDPNGYIPLGFGRITRALQDVPQFAAFAPREFRIVDPISSVALWIETILSKGDGLYFPITHSSDVDGILRGHVNPMIADQVSFLVKLNEYQVRAIPEQIKDKVLDWACALERAGVHGDGMSFSDKEKQISHSVTFNINNSSIEQLNNMGTNHKG